MYLCFTYDLCCNIIILHAIYTDFWQNLEKGVDLVSEDTRFPKDYHGLPNRIGQILHPEKFDSKFFGVGKAQASCLDPQISFRECS